MGEYTKTEVRAVAKKFDLPVHEKRESQEICFVAENDYREFLRRHIPADYFKPGEIVDTDGNVVGKHDGLINYTIGQRKGIDQLSVVSCQLSAKKPLYVIRFDAGKNQLVVGEDKDVYMNKMELKSIHFIQSNELRVKNNAEIQVKIRYRHEAVGCSVTNSQETMTSKIPISNIQYPSSLSVEFDEPQRAITPGQSAVFYDGDEVVGGGIIK